MNTVLIVDDDEINRRILIHALQEDYELLEAENGKKALDIVANNLSQIDLILLDILMPEMNGIELLEILNQKKLLNSIPVVLITGDKTEEVEAECYKLGAADFITKPYDIKVIRYIIDNTINLYQEKKQWKKLGIVQYRKLKEQAEFLRRENEHIIELLGTLTEYRGTVDKQHTQKVKQISTLIAKTIGQLYPEYNISDEEADNIGVASCLHDIGKNLIPDAVLYKPGRLDDTEMELMKSHTTKGCEMLQATLSLQQEDYKQLCYDICRSHHERYDGKGYPDGLVGDTIPIAAQIVSIAECFDALVSDTVYRERYDSEKAYNMLLNGECGTFSPAIIECFKNNYNSIVKIVDMDVEQEISE